MIFPILIFLGSLFLAYLITKFYVFFFNQLNVGKSNNFVSMMRADSKGKKRPCIIGLDWNVKPNEIRDEVESAVVVAISDQIHVFAEVEYIRRNWKWRMLVCYSPYVITEIKLNTDLSC